MAGNRKNERIIRAPRGTALTAKSWATEAPLRMLMNNLHPDVAENPHELVVYGGIGRAAHRSRWTDHAAWNHRQHGIRAPVDSRGDALPPTSHPSSDHHSRSGHRIARGTDRSRLRSSRVARPRGTTHSPRGCPLRCCHMATGRDSFYVERRESANRGSPASMTNFPPRWATPVI